MDSMTLVLIGFGVVTGLIGFVATIAVGIAGWSLVTTIEQGKQISTLQQQGTDQSRAMHDLGEDVKAARQEFRDGLHSIRNLFQNVLLERAVAARRVTDKENGNQS